MASPLYDHDIGWTSPVRHQRSAEPYCVTSCFLINGMHFSEASGEFNVWPPMAEDSLFRTALSTFLASGLSEDPYTERTVLRLTRMLCADNAKRAYALGDQM